ncbi:Uncharacterised protein [Hafnia alvei]|uniref:Uncharacterized protein n=1 Tax=Hafnia alvei TaxID=569 RepID=A0A377PR45_HAFAL|nr:Uncharacterised protein [Hafnia alvei]
MEVPNGAVDISLSIPGAEDLNLELNYAERPNLVLISP